MKRIGMFEAKTHFSEIVDRVVREGRPITITKRGEPVVEITPAKTRSSKIMTRKQAIAALKKLRAEVPTLNQEQIRALIDEGRH
ncbi:MAG: type II toxin-antitoxin system Phd/YefM family antitoxin [Planctomycetes bacterium]|nr:type II toxin-antitoxin system Phd/YefM family antitoxin [Planctomycetota bacterium]